MKIEWRAESRTLGGVERRHVSTVERHIDPKHALPIGAIYRVLLRAAAEDLASWLKQPAG